ncbi:MAG TPA: SMC-Scp complex subunit ScpB [Xanthomonadaceae bacterium]|nr:SMC-Scp complex subunit ScpB [Xanthomonadaceae bacterium]
MEQDQLNRIIEAALLAAAQPLTLAQLAALFGEEEKPAPGAIEKALEQLAEACQERGIELREVASGYRYQVRQDVHPWVSRLWTERQTRYSRALLETLALIAYRQPITRGEIEQIRGVAVSTNIIRTLEERDWIRVVGYRDVPGKPALLGTSRVFLDYFNLKSLDQLPPLAEIRDLEDLEPELDLGGTAPVAPPVAADAGDAGPSEDIDFNGSDPVAKPAKSTTPAETETADIGTAIEPAAPGEVGPTPLERAP